MFESRVSTLRRPEREAGYFPPSNTSTRNRRSFSRPRRRSWISTSPTSIANMKNNRCLHGSRHVMVLRNSGQSSFQVIMEPNVSPLDPILRRLHSCHILITFFFFRFNIISNVHLDLPSCPFPWGFLIYILHFPYACHRSRPSYCEHQLLPLFFIPKFLHVSHHSILVFIFVLMSVTEP